MTLETDFFNALGGSYTETDTGTAQAGSANTLTLAADADADNGAHEGQVLSLTGGAGSAQSRTISAYNGQTKVATVSPNWNAQYVSLPGESGDYASTPDSAALQLSTFDLRVLCAPGDWTPAASPVVAAQRTSGAGNHRWRLIMLSSGVLRLAISENGTNDTYLLTSSQAVGGVDGQQLYIRVTLEFAAGTYTARFYKSTDGSTWTQIGTDVTAGGGAGIGINTGGTPTLSLGMDPAAAGSAYAMNLYWAELRNGVDGTVVAKFDPVNDGGKIGDTSFVSSTGETWTINQSGSPMAELGGAPDATTEYSVPNKLNAPLLELVGDNIIPMHASHGVSARKYVVWTVLFTEPRYDLDGVAGLTRATLQVDCYAESAIEAIEVAAAVIAAVPATGWPLHRTGHREQDFGLEPGTRLYRRMLELSIFHRG